MQSFKPHDPRTPEARGDERPILLACERCASRGVATMVRAAAIAPGSVTLCAACTGEPSARKPRQRTGAEELRIIVSNLDVTSETFNDRYTASQLLQIGRMLLASEWDFLPDRWTDRQVEEALAGRPPTWSDDEEPTYSTTVEEP